jgi:CRP-like cAMP-binding protein
MAQSPNRLLASLSAEVFSLLQPHLKPVDLNFADVLGDTGQPITSVYFPHSGIVSLVVELSVGSMIETAMVGRDGAANAASALDGKVSLNKAIVQVAGKASAIDAHQLSNIADGSKELRSLLIRHEQLLFAQAQQSAACNASHVVEARMCRWLLRMRDLTDGNDLSLTQEFLAQMMGVRRTSVSLVAGTLQKAGLISYRRGHIRILDVAGVADGACECYATVSAQYEQMLSK